MTAHTECRCGDLDGERFCCRVTGRQMTPDLRGQCRASQAFRDGFARLNPSPACGDYSGPARGLGDLVERGLKAVGVHQIVKAATKGGCGCGKRRDALNRLVPFGPKTDQPAPPPTA